VGCGRIAPKSELLRIGLRNRVDAVDAVDALGEGNRVDAVAAREAVADRDGRLPGRGAYLCRDQSSGRPEAACLALALRRKALPRALRASVTVSSELVESNPQ
jgi:predicted RNA-binding protein YlxR (DUF448 family)